MRVIELLKQNTVILAILIALSGFTPGDGNVLGGQVDSYIASAQEDDASENLAWQSYSRSEYWEYTTQSGDTLEVIAARFQVGLSDIDHNPLVPADQLLDPGLMLGIQRPRLDSSLLTALLPDMEVVYSPSTKEFSTRDYVASAEGYLNGHQEYMRSTGLTAAAEIIQRVAIENSIHPRLLLALLEYQCGCVTGPLGEGMDPENLMGIQDPLRRGLYRQLGWTVNHLSMGYYGWRQGLFNHLVLLDGSVLLLPPDLNAGSAAVTYLFSQLADRDRWDRAMGPEQGFTKIHQELFPDIWQAGYDAQELFPPGLSQPDMILPFEVDREWSYTSGPHPAWETEGATAALDFAPASERFGCEPSSAWVLAAADGMVARSEHNALVLDLDGDGQEGTGWALLYMHVADYQRAPAGSYLERGDPVGHPSCEGGPADGTHIHLARKFNGEWIAAGGPLPFVMSGWVAQAGFRPYDGSLIRGDHVVRANPLSPAAAFISRSSEDALREARISHGLWWEE
jgi:LasA protease